MAIKPADNLASASRAEKLRASPRMFESDLLDKLSRVHPSVPPILFLPTIAFLLVEGFVHSVGWAAPAWLLGGYVFWTLTEYWLHRVVFHFEPEQGIGARLHWIIHGVHHDHPNDPLRLVMPPAVSVPLGAVVFGVLYLVFGGRYAPALGAGFFAGYLAYDMTHYYLHHFRPRGRMGRILRERHMRHHFQDETRGFGISAPYWDDIFKTSSRSPRPSEPQSPNARN
jgi:sterol desaturase/sphingolipid hydroxylase (fatty acid hydroxylase superfamily)